jgi:hypothetical protein
MDAPNHCPICHAKTKPLDKAGDEDGLDCPTHGKFKVARTVWSLSTTANASRKEWEAALKLAQGRAKPGEWPLIQSYDLP